MARNEKALELQEILKKAHYGHSLSSSEVTTLKEAVDLLNETYMFLAFQSVLGTNYGGDIGWAFTYNADMRKAILDKLQPFTKVTLAEVTIAQDAILALKAKNQQEN